MSPAKLNDIELDNENKTANIYADEDQISLIIGKSGQNIKLAGKLTGYQINVVRMEHVEEEEDEDVGNEENEEIEEISKERSN